MEEDWGADASTQVKPSQTPQTGSWNVPKLRGFGRGKPVNITNGSQASNPGMTGGGFGKPSGGFGKPDDDEWDDDAWNGSSTGGGFGKSSGGFGKPSGGFGRPAGGRAGAADSDDDWGTSATNGFGGRTDGGGFGARGSNFGGGRRGGDSGCRKCGEDGHWARDCPNDGAGGHKGGRGCHKCGEEGHFARECPNGGGGVRGGGRACHKCGEEGHMARDCPSGGGGGGRGRNCHKCGEEGHLARDCTNSDVNGGGTGTRGAARNGDSRRNDGFGGGNRDGFGGGNRDGFGGSVRSGFGSSRGGGFGASKGRGGGGFGDSGDENENDRWGRPGRGRGGFGDAGDGAPKRGDSGCRRCGEEGHFARECPNGGGGGGGGRGVTCHKCGGEGHFARDCSKPAADGEKPREIYVPPALDEELLFKEGVHQGINFDKYDNIEVEVSGNNRVDPIIAFEDAGLLPTFLKNVQRAGYTKPTPIQKYAIPSIMAGRDLMGCAQTGSGKTAAFILPVLTSMIKEGLTCSAMSEIKEPQTIVVAPTRELADQIYKEARKFSMHTDLRPVVVYGGVSVAHQLRQVEMGANLVVGTPGRLLDFIERGKISLHKVKFLILDEADRMLDMGFEPSIRKLVDSMGMPPKTERQTLMFSATFKPEIQKLAADFMNDYLFITVGIVGGACTDVEQTFLEVDRLQKREYLCDILNTSGTNRVLVFVGQKRNADFLASFLSQSGYPTTTIHGDRLQREREQALLDFKMGKSPVLIATNVAARGLDIPDVTHVVNYDLPSDIDEYVHRIGRTGRCGNLGKATSFYSQDTDYSLAGSLVKILAEASQEVPEWLAEYAASGGASGGDRFTGRFASKDIRRKKFDNADDFSKGGANHDYGGHGADYGGSYGGTTAFANDDDEQWD